MIDSFAGDADGIVGATSVRTSCAGAPWNELLSTIAENSPADASEFQRGLLVGMFVSLILMFLSLRSLGHRTIDALSPPASNYKKVQHRNE